jgi:hypothetical protein
MCVNLQTSIIAFIVGIVCGLILATEDNEKRALGIFIMFYSFVQLCEAYIYYFGKDETKLASKLLLINLGLQGIVYFILISYYVQVNTLFFLICGLVSLLVTFKATERNFKAANIETCMKWNFMDNITSYSLIIMYITIITYSQLSSNKIINISGKYFILTYILAYLMQGNGPSLWCLSSAITSPLLLLL